MGKLWAVIRREYIERVATKSFLIGTLIAPLLFSAVLFIPAVMARRAQPSARASDIIILDATGAEGVGQRVADAVRTAVQGRAASAPAPDVRIVTPDGLAQAETLAVADVRAKKRQGYLVLGGASLRGDSARYAGRNASSVADVERIRGALRGAMMAERLRNAGVSPALVDSLAERRLVLSTERLTDRGRGGSGAGNMMAAVMMAFLLYTAMLLYGQMVLRGVLEEKTSRVAEVVISSVKPETLLAGKILGVGAVGLTQMALWLVSISFLGSFIGGAMMRTRGGTDMTALRDAGAADLAASSMSGFSFGVLGLIIVFFLLGYTFYSSLYAAAGAMVNSEQEAQQALTPVLMFVIASALLIQPVLLNPGSSLARVASIVPFSAPIIMPLRMSLVHVPPLDIGLSVLGLLLACAVSVWLAGRIYRVGMLMYGTKPSLGELARWIRAA